MLSLPQLLFYQAIFLHEIFGVGGLYDAMLVPLDATLAGKLVTALCMLELPLVATGLAATVWMSDERRRRWSGLLVVANLMLMAVIVSHLVFEGLHEARLG